MTNVSLYLDDSLNLNVDRERTAVNCEIRKVFSYTESTWDKNRLEIFSLELLDIANLSSGDSSSLCESIALLSRSLTSNVINYLQLILIRCEALEVHVHFVQVNHQ